MPEIIGKSPYILERLKLCPFLQAASQDTVSTVWKLAGVKQYDKGEIILRAKEEFSNISILLSGKVIQYNLTHSGKRKILFIFGAGRLLNDHVFDTHTSTIYCEAIERVEVLLIPKAEFVKLMEKDFSLMRGIMAEQEWKMWRLSHQLKNTVGSIYLERKLAAKLWKLARDFGIRRESGVEIDVNMSVTFLADMLGVPRETASRLCRNLAEQGLIRQEKKRVIVCDPDRMAHFYKTGEKDNL